MVYVRRYLPISDFCCIHQARVRYNKDLLHAELYYVARPGACNDVSISPVYIYICLLFAGAFYLYASFGVVGIIYFYFFLPETRGRSLEEMESLFSGSWFVRRQQLKTPTASDQGSNPCSDQEAN